MRRLKFGLTALVILTTIGGTEAAEKQLRSGAAGDVPECYLNGKPGTCFPSVYQCQSCCIGQFDCGSPTGSGPRINIPLQQLRPAPAPAIPAEGG